MSAIDSADDSHEEFFTVLAKEIGSIGPDCPNTHKKLNGERIVEKLSAAIRGNPKYQAQMNQLLQNIGLSNADAETPVNLLADLPLELQLVILGNLKNPDGSLDIENLKSACKGDRRLIPAANSLIQSQANQFVSLKSLGFETIESVIKFIEKYPLTSLNLEGFNRLTEDDLSKLLQNCPDLERLSIQGNKTIQKVPELPPKLKVLNCCHTYITTLPENLPGSLEILDCSISTTTTLPNLPASLKELRCLNSSVYTLPTLPASLKILDCGMCSIATLPTLPESLEMLSLSGCGRIRNLPERLPSSLKQLYCDRNNISTLPNLPAPLIVLVCGTCPITALPNLPDSLEILNYLGCPIAEPPTSFPPSLKILNGQNINVH